ncbi:MULTISPECIES: WD40 repeat domain-containing protein [unclassified Crossiella]|uniref:WD40 repeat domain-containing protein n=1 Tax=unclassified Crossiella TaxID=2620835 RepID=UPI0020003A29|nr:MULTISPECIES: WD40 repeat domain-containing protein [unclassified Crossiella]MCK2240898.1 hypothetical protein [Crossiella sp. S99.2]MCK2253958.1 hypothetical protein [Crossiella sp. S99.1]
MSGMGPDNLAKLADILLSQIGRAPDGSRRWAEADPYLLRHAVQHAVDGGRIDELLTDAEFLVYADPATLVPALPGASQPAAVTAATVYRIAIEDVLSATPERRRQYLAMNSARLGATVLAHRLSRPAGTPLPLAPLFSTGSQIMPAVRAVFDDGDFRVHAVVVTRVADRHVVVSTCTDRDGYDTIIRFRDLHSGELTVPSIRLVDEHREVGARPWHQDLLAAAEVDGAAVVVMRSRDSLVVRSAATGEVVRVHPVSNGGCLATGVLAGRAVVAVDEDPGVLVRDLHSGVAIIPVIDAPAGEICSLEIAEIGDHPILVGAVASTMMYGDNDPGGTCWVVDLQRGTRIGPVHQCPPRSGSLTARLAQLDGRPVIVTGPRHVHTTKHGTREQPMVQIRDVFTGEDRFPAWSQYEGVTALAATVLDGRAALVIASGDGAVTVRELGGAHDPRELMRLPVARGYATDLKTVRTAGRTLIVAACDDGVVRVADMVQSKSGPTDVSPGHEIGVESVALARVDGHPVVLSGGLTGDLYRRDARAGGRVSLLRHGDLRITDIAVGTLGGRTVAVTGSPQAGVRLHDLASGLPLTDYPEPGAEKAWVHSVDLLWPERGPVIVGAGDEGRVWMWDVRTGELLLRWIVPDDDHRAVWRAILLDGAPVLVGLRAPYASDVTIGHVLQYDLSTLTRRDVTIDAFEGYNARQSLAVHDQDETPLLVFADFEGTLAVWEARTGALVSRVVNTDDQRYQTALACTTVGGRAVAVVGTQTGHLGVHDLRTGERIMDTVVPGGWIHCLAVDDDGLVAIGYGREVAVLDMGALEIGGDL